MISLYKEINVIEWYICSMNRTLYCCLIFFFSALSFSVKGQVSSIQQIEVNRRNSIVHKDKPYVILISIDGMRHDYIEKYKAHHLEKLAQSGVKATWMIPSFPTLTFPNHYTIATGLFPSHHGVVANSFYDKKMKQAYRIRDRSAVENPKWYGGTPIWVLAEKQAMLSASYFWVGSEAPVQGTYPSYHYKYNENTSINDRIKTVVDWLNLPIEKRPHLITFYMPEVDHAGHAFGPDSKEVEQSVHYVDTVIQKLNDAVVTTGLPINIIIVSDHGMTSVNQSQPIAIPVEVDKDEFSIISSGTLVHLYAHESTSVKEVYRKLKRDKTNYDVYLKKKLPRKLKYSSKNDQFNRIGDIVMLAKTPYVFHQNASSLPNPGAHGYDSRVNKEMMAIFMAWGPNIKESKRIKPFSNVEVYPLIADILGLKITENIDAKGVLSKKIIY